MRSGTVLTRANIRDCFSSRMQTPEISGRRVTQIISPIIGHDLSLLEFPLSCSLDTAARRGAKSSPSRCTTISASARLFCYRTNAHIRLIVYSNSLFSSSARAYVCARPYRTDRAILAFMIFLFSQ